MKAWIWLACLGLLCACSSPQPPVANSDAKVLRHAQGFTLQAHAGYWALILRNPWSSEEWNWLLVPDSLRSTFHADSSQRNWPILTVPLRKSLVLSTTHLAFLRELGVLQNVVGTGKLDLVQDSLVRQALLGKAEVGYGPEIQMERVLQLAPDAVITFAVGDARFDDFSRLQNAHIPTLVLLDWLENHPLAKLEWIKLFGVLYGKSAQADSLYLARVAAYDSLQQLAQSFKTMPTVFTGAPWNDNWQLTGGRSYFAQYLRDAHAHYLWEQDTNTSGLSLQIEQVLQKAQNAEYWLNPGIWKTRTEGIKTEPRIQLFRAFIDNKCYQPELIWEQGAVRPDLVLQDLIQILHPQEMATKPLSFYQPLAP